MCVNPDNQNTESSESLDGYACLNANKAACLDDVIRRMILQGISEGHPRIAEILNHYFATVETMLMEGMAVNTPCARYRIAVCGDGGCAGTGGMRIVPHVSPSRRLQDRVEKNSRTILAAIPDSIPRPVAYLDLNTGETNSLLTSCGIGEIRGHFLSHNGTDAAQGIFFISLSGTETRVEVVGQNTFGKLTFIVPFLKEGNYNLELRAGTPCGQLFSGRLQAILRVL